MRVVVLVALLTTLLTPLTTALPAPHAPQGGMRLAAGQQARPQRKPCHKQQPAFPPPASPPANSVPLLPGQPVPQNMLLKPPPGQAKPVQQAQKQIFVTTTVSVVPGPTLGSAPPKPPVLAQSQVSPAPPPPAQQPKVQPPPAQKEQAQTPPAQKQQTQPPHAQKPKVEPPGNRQKDPVASPRPKNDQTPAPPTPNKAVAVPMWKTQDPPQAQPQKLDLPQLLKHRNMLEKTGLEIKPPTYEILPWDQPQDMIPSACKRFAETPSAGEKLTSSPQDMETFVVKYADCGSGQWVMCRHKDAQMSQEDLIKTFGQLPISMRQFIRNVAAFPSYSNSSTLWAIHQASSIRFNGKHKFDPLGTLIMHEFAHTADSLGMPKGKIVSRTPEWEEAVNKDKMVLSPYATESLVENFAEAFVAATYDKLLPGGLKQSMPQVEWHKIANQLEFIKNRHESLMQLGGTCTEPITSSDPVKKSG